MDYSFISILIGILLCLQIVPTNSEATKYIDAALHHLLEENSCKDVGMSSGNCNISTSCTLITCEGHLPDTPVTVSITIDRCHVPVAITTNVKSSNTALDWTHRFTSNGIEAVPGFHYKQSSALVGEFLKANFSTQDNTLKLQISFHSGTKTTSYSESSLIDQDIPLSSKHCSFLVWWKSQSSPVRILIVVAIAIAAFSLVSGCCCCCFCSPCRTKKSVTVKHRSSRRMLSLRAYYSGNSQSPGI